MNHQQQLKLGLLFIVAALLTACGAARFNMHGGSDDNDGLSNNSPQPPLICDPFSSSAPTTSDSGIKGSIFKVDPATAAYSKSSELVGQGQRVPARLFLNRLTILPRSSFDGFLTEDGLLLRDQSGQVLTEWFALELESRLKLASGEAQGYYQIAVLSDDGSTMKILGSNGQYQNLIENEMTHPTRMGCAATAIPMSATSRIPFKLSYFQGPHNELSLTMMWRKVDPNQAGSLDEQECGYDAPAGYFFEASTVNSPAVMQPAFQNLLARGWKPLSADNFEIGSQQNLCR